MSSDITYAINLIKNKVAKARFMEDRRSWHHDVDVEIREVMAFCISQLIRGSGADDEDQLYTQKLHEVAQYIEQHLYFSAFSLKDYKDPVTLVERVSYLCLKLLYDFAMPNETVVRDENHVLKYENDSGIDSNSKPESDPNGDKDKKNGSPEIVFSSALFSSEYVMKQYENSRMTLKQSGLVNDVLMPPAASFCADNNVQSPDTSIATENPVNNLSATTCDDKQVPVSASIAHDAHGMIPPNIGMPNIGMYIPIGHRPIPHNAKANAISVSSQGCSRVFIIKVLRIIAEFVRGKSLPSIFTFKKELVRSWLSKAKDQCKTQNYINEELEFGGPPFIENDPSTHWLEPNQLYTWWKNNVERRQKFRILQEDAMYNGDDARKKMRARWCQAIVNLSEIIRRSSGSSVAARANMNLHNTIISNLAMKRVYSPSQVLGVAVNNNLCNEEFNIYNSQGDEEAQQVNPISISSTNVYNTPSERVRLKTKFDETQLRNIRKELDSSQRRREYYRKKKLDLVNGLDFLNSGDGDVDDFQMRTWTRTFPHKLYDLINGAKDDIVCWAEDGKSFSIRNINRFIMEVLPMSFKQKSFLSFQRQLNLYGFKRVPHILRGTYFHPYFIKGRVDLIDKVRRLQSHLEAEVTHYKKMNKMKNTHQLLTLASNADLIDAVGIIPLAPGASDSSPDDVEPRQKRKYTKRNPVDFVDPDDFGSDLEDEDGSSRPQLRNRKNYTQIKSNKTTNGKYGDDDMEELEEDEDEDEEEEDDEDEDDNDNGVEDRRLKSQIGKYNDEDFEYYNYKKVPSKASKNNRAVPSLVKQKKNESTTKRARGNSFSVILARFYNKLGVTTPEDTDLLDLVQPKKRRIFLDFINDDEEKPAKGEATPVKVVEVNSCGPFHGIYLPKLSNTVQSMYNVDVCSIRGMPSDNNLSRGYSRMSPRTNNNYNEPKSSRVGPEYQASCPDVIAYSGSLGPRSVSSSHCVKCWDSTSFNNKLGTGNIDEFIMQIKKHMMGDRFLPIGALLMVTVPDVVERRNRLVCILDYVDCSTMTSVSIVGMNSDNVLVRVHDGNQDLYVAYSCIIDGAFGLSYYNNAYDWLHQNNYRIPNTEIEYNRMLDVVFKNLVPCPLSTWSSDEVETILDGIRRYGDDVKKVYNLLVSNNDNKNNVVRTFSEVLAFYHVIFPHAHSIGARKVISLFNRAERASQGFPDVESDDDDDEEEDGDYFSQDDMAEEESNVDDQEMQVPPEAKRPKGSTVASKKAVKNIKSASAVDVVESAVEPKKKARRSNVARAPKANDIGGQAPKQEPEVVLTSSFSGRKRALNPKYLD